MGAWSRLLRGCLTIAVAIGLALHVAQSGTMALAMGPAAQAPAMPDCDRSGDAAAPAACDPACAASLAALPPPGSDGIGPAPGRLAAARAAGLVGLAGPPDPHPPRGPARL
jgi:hypothetical protein